MLLDVPEPHARALREALATLHGGRAPSGYEGLSRVELEARLAKAESAIPSGSDVIERIKKLVALRFSVPVALLAGHRRHKSVAFVRHVAMYVCRRKTRGSYPDIGRAFGNRDHTTVISAVRKISSMVAIDEALARRIAAIERELEAVAESGSMHIAECG